MNLSRCFYPVAMVILGLLSGEAIAADFIDLRRIDPIHGDAKAAETAVTGVCIACHGPSGVSPVPMFPDLAGQKADYLYHQLLRIKSGTSPESPMTAIVAPYSDADLRNFSAYYAALPAAEHPAAIADQNLFERGGILFQEGDSRTGVPPCQACHGVGARGVHGDQYLTYPLLRHQKADYTVTRLQEYRSGKLGATSNDFIMQSVAHRLDDDAIAALAAWLASAP